MNKKTLTKVYRYGLTKPGLSQADSQLFWDASKLIHQFDNEIISIHNKYVKDFKYQERQFYLLSQDKDKFEKIYQALSAIENKFQELILENKKLNSLNLERTFSKDISDQLSQLKSERKDLYSSLDDLRKKYKKSIELENIKKIFFEKEKSLPKEMYDKYTKLGMHWSIANDCIDRYEKSLKSLPTKVFGELKLKKFNSSFSRIIIQCRSSSDKKFIVNRLFDVSSEQAPAKFDSISDEQKQFLLNSDDCILTNIVANLKLRINSEISTDTIKVPIIYAKGPKQGHQKLDRKTKQPLFKEKSIKKSCYLTLPIKFHRPLPKNCIIKNIELIREVHGSKINYFVNFYVNYEEEIFDDKNLPNAGLDIGFRKIDDNTIRLAAIADDKNNYDLLNLNISAKQKINDLKSIIDLEFNKFKKDLKDSFKEFSNNFVNIEKYSKDLSNKEKLFLHLRNLMLAKSPYKLYSTFKYLKSIIDFDDNLQKKMFETLKKYAYHHYHLNTWKANSERKFILRRREQFRVLSKKLKDSYSKLYIEDINLSKFAEKSDIVSKKELSNIPRTQRFDAGLSILRICLENKFGDNLIKVNPVYTSKTHFKCGNKLELDSSTIMQHCPYCKEGFDRDFNAAQNILKRGKASSASSLVTPKAVEAA